MFKNTGVFSGFSVDDLQSAKEFYADKLGLNVAETSQGLGLTLKSGGEVFIYPKPNHEPATFTVLNFRVDDIEAGVQKLIDAGIAIEHYEGMTDEMGVMRGISINRGPDIAWFKDPAGNILSVLQEA